MKINSIMSNPCLVLAALLILGAQPAWSDPFLEPATLPDGLEALTFTNGETGATTVVRLDENHLPVTADFFGEEASIPFSIEGSLVESASGNRLLAWRILPKSAANGVAVLFLHGNGGNILSNLGAGVALVKQGFRVTIVDYSGYGWSSGEATRANVLDDAVSTLELVSDAARAAGDRLVLYGQSLGGHLAVVVGAAHADRIDALVIEGAFTSHRDIASEFKGSLAGAFVSEPYSAEESIGDYRKPLLVIHSRDDEVVPFSMGQELFEAANDPKAFLEIGGPHLAGLAQDPELIVGEMLALLDER